MTYNKEEFERNIRNKKCWICRRTIEESLSEFKKNILEYEDKDTLHSNIKDIIKNNEIMTFPDATDWDSDTLIRFGAFNKETGEDIEINSNSSVSIHICPVCDTILTEIWQSSQDNAIETIKEEYNKKIIKAAYILMENEEDSI